ncbi:hypothetical protein EsH8_X_000355 [Colletotrichum jinshuiense]
MPSYLVTGANRGIGWAFLRKLSDDANNTVIGTARDKSSAEKKVASELRDRPNVHIVEVEMSNFDSIKASVDIVSKITGGKLDCIIANAATVSDWSAYDDIGKLGETPQKLEEELLECFKVNVVGNVHLFNLYLPLILKGDVKKVITISSGMADIDLINQYRIDVSAPYSISKGAVNVAVSKFHARYAEDGILFLGVSPGLVDTGHNDNLTEDQVRSLQRTSAQFNAYAPGAKPVTPEESVTDVLKVIYNSSLENGHGGAFISHLGTKRWFHSVYGFERVIMSFGFSAGDFLAVYQIANKVRKEFIGAPGQFKHISDEVRNLSIILQDSECTFEANESHHTIHDNEQLKEITFNCQSVLDELTKTLEKYRDLKDGGAQRGAKEKVKRAWKRLTFEPEDIRDLRSRICSNIAALDAYNTRITRDNTNTLLRNQENQEHESILNWLTEVDFGSQHSHNLSRRQSGTGKWFIDSQQYQTWLQDKKKTLFCPGIPGAGKTIMTAIVIEDLHRRIDSDTSFCLTAEDIEEQVDTKPEVGLAFVYCDFKTRHKLEDLLASLVKQLSQQSEEFPECVVRLYGCHKHMNTRPSVAELSETLKIVAKSYYSKVFIVIDAIDECSTKDNTRTKFSKAMTNLQDAPDVTVNIMVTSRHLPSVKNMFGGHDSTQIEIKANSEDVGAYLDAQMVELPDFATENPKLLRDIKTVILETVAGMFLLANLYLGSLQGQTTPRGIRDALNRLPVGSETLMYDFAYEDAMSRIQGQPKGHIDLAMQLLAWITSVERPLKTAQLIDALAVEPDDEWFDEERRSRIVDLISVCAGLVIVDYENDTVRLVHYTTQEYFDRTRNKWFPNADSNITRTCLTYLSITHLDPRVLTNEKGQFSSLGPLGEYALVGWAIHGNRVMRSGKLADPPKETNFLMRVMSSFLDTTTAVALARFLSYVVFYDDGETDVEDSFGIPSPSWLHLAAIYDLGELIEFKGGCDINAKDCLGRTPLHCAAVMGHTDIILILLNMPDVDINVRDHLGRSALWWAVSGCKATVVELLLRSENINANARGGKGSFTPSQLAVERKHEPSFKALLESGKVDIGIPFENGETILTRAIKKGDSSIMKLITEHDIHNIPDVVYRLLNPSLLEALRFNQSHMFERLHKNSSPDIDRTCRDAVLSCLFETTSLRYTLATKLLLEIGTDIGVNIDAEGGPFNETLLLRAVAAWDKTTAELLLDHGADINAESTFTQQTPLSRAIHSQNESMVKLLLARGADVHKKSSATHETPLLQAAGISKRSIFLCIVESAGDLSSDVKGNLLSKAIRSQNEEVVKLLSAKGADVNNLVAGAGLPPDFADTNEGQEKVVSCLTEKDSVNGTTTGQMTTEDSMGQTIEPLTHTQVDGPVEKAEESLTNVEDSAEKRNGDSTQKTGIDLLEKTEEASAENME